MFGKSSFIQSCLAAVTVCGGLCFAAVPAGAFDDDYFRIVDIADGDVLAVLSNPRPGARIVGTIPFDGQGIEHLASGADSYWALVRYAGRQGWVNKRYLIEQIEEGSVPGYDIFEPTRVTRVRRNDVLNVRTRPSARARKIAKLAPDAVGVLVIRRHTNGWALISFDGSRGWVNARYLAPVAY